MPDIAVVKTGPTELFVLRARGGGGPQARSADSADINRAASSTGGLAINFGLDFNDCDAFAALDNGTVHRLAQTNVADPWTGTWTQVRSDQGFHAVAVDSGRAANGLADAMAVDRAGCVFHAKQATTGTFEPWMQLRDHGRGLIGSSGGNNRFAVVRIGRRLTVFLVDDRGQVLTAQQAEPDSCHWTEWVMLPTPPVGLNSIAVETTGPFDLAVVVAIGRDDRSFECRQGPSGFPTWREL